MSKEPPKKLQKLENVQKRITYESESENSNKKYKCCPSASLSPSNLLPIDEEFVIRIAQNDNQIDKKAQRKCKILIFTSEWDYDKILLKLADLKGHEFPSLFIFIIESINLEISNEKQPKIPKILKEFLIKFSTKRPIILQLSLIAEFDQKFYYKNVNSNEFIYLVEPEILIEQIQDFPSFFWNVMNKGIEIFEHLPFHVLLRHDSTWLRISRILKLPEDTFIDFIIQCASNGSTNDFLAALDIPFEGGNQILNTNALEYLRCTFNDEDSSSESSESVDSDSDCSTKSNEGHLLSSVLSYAVENSNENVVNYVIRNYTHIIQQLPFKHQVQVSTIAYQKNKFKTLCDLLEYSDFPFPKKFSINNERLKIIIDERKEFHHAIVNKDFTALSKFIDSHLNLKFVYNPKNQTALLAAVNMKKYGVYWYLKSLGFQTHNSKNYIDLIKDNKELEKAKKIALKQTKKNVIESLACDHEPVLILLTKTFIHNKKIDKQTEFEYRQNIKEWYECIYVTEFGPLLLGIASQCENLKLIFDFECITVENMDLKSSGASGTTYPLSKWIFIGAKLFEGNENRGQKIKGAIAHELCHYVMRFVYENNENPYFENNEDAKSVFDNIVNLINKWTSQDSQKSISNIEVVNDECDGIISTVYTSYDKKEYHAELIVRVVHILAQFDDNQQKIISLKHKYEILFNYFIQYVLPELKKFNLSEREHIKELNNLVELLKAVKSQSFKFNTQIIVQFFSKNAFNIFKTNTPKLLLAQLYEHIKNEDKNLLEVNNIFMPLEKLKNEIIFKKLNEIIIKNANVRLVINCSNEIDKNLLQSIFNLSSNVNFVISNENQAKVFEEFINFNNLKISLETVNYSWNDLNHESQKKLLQKKINFQNNLISLLCLLKKSDIIETNEDFSDIINDDFLNSIVEDSDIIINFNFQHEKDFQILFRSRKLIKKHKNCENIKKSFQYFDSDSQSESDGGFDKKMVLKRKIRRRNYKKRIIDQLNEDKTISAVLSQEELLEDVKNDKFVLISNIAGSGKSWLLKSIQNLINNQNQARWITFIDLKNFIKDLSKMSVTENFLSFMTEKLLKNMTIFEKRIFKQLYKNGRVCIFFDGFDEIAPDCAEFVINLAKTFKQSNGNQLWISTRDYFEVDLQEKLGIDVVYKLDEFTEIHGKKLIASYWILEELKLENPNFNLESNFVDKIKNHTKFKNYKKQAKNLIQISSGLRHDNRLSLNIITVF